MGKSLSVPEAGLGKQAARQMGIREEKSLQINIILKRI
jgi:hypothetical protein